MSEKIVPISADERLSTVEDIMTLGGVRHMPVVRAGRLVGVVSERDLLRASLSNLTAFGNEQRRAFLQAVEIGRVMSTPPVVVDPDVTVEEAALVMVEKRMSACRRRAPCAWSLRFRDVLVPATCRAFGAGGRLSGGRAAPPGSEGPHWHVPRGFRTLGLPPRGTRDGL